MRLTAQISHAELWCRRRRRRRRRCCCCCLCLRELLQLALLLPYSLVAGSDGQGDEEMADWEQLVAAVNEQRRHEGAQQVRAWQVALGRQRTWHGMRDMAP